MPHTGRVHCVVDGGVLAAELVCRYHEGDWLRTCVYVAVEVPECTACASNLTEQMRPKGFQGFPTAETGIPDGTGAYVGIRFPPA